MSANKINNKCKKGDILSNCDDAVQQTAIFLVGGLELEKDACDHTECDGVQEHGDSSENKHEDGVWEKDQKKD